MCCYYYVIIKYPNNLIISLLTQPGRSCVNVLQLRNSSQHKETRARAFNTVTSRATTICKDTRTHLKYKVAALLTKYIKLFDELQLCDYGIILFKSNLVCRSNLDINKLKGEYVCVCVYVILS